MNHLGACIALDALEELAEHGTTSIISWEDLRSYLQRIRAVRSNGEWHLAPLKKSVQKFLNKLDMSEKEMDLLNTKPF